MLKSHIPIESAVSNAKYPSPPTQNELIAFIESEIRKQSVRRCNKSPSEIIIILYHELFKSSLVSISSVERLLYH